MGQLSQEQINKDLFDEVQRLKGVVKQKDQRIEELEKKNGWLQDKLCQEYSMEVEELYEFLERIPRNSPKEMMNETK